MVQYLQTYVQIILHNHDAYYYESLVLASTKVIQSGRYILDTFIE